jgi:ketosteroid isomerase-like protein
MGVRGQKGEDMGHPNEAVVREYLRAFNEGNLDRVGELLADDVIVHFPGRNPISGEKRGKDEVMSFFKTMMERAGVGSLPPDIHDVLASDDRAVALMTRLVAGINAPVAVVYEIRNGRIVEVWPHERDQYAVDEALSRALGKKE